MNKANFSKVLRDTGNALKQASGIEIFSRHRPKVRFNGVQPFQTNDTFVAPSAVMIGDVTCWDQSSLWHKAIARADCGHSITIGFSSNVGEGSVLKTLSASAELDTGYPPDTHIGHYVTVGSGCVLKSCRIDDLVIIGDKCTILEGSMIDDHVIVEPGSVVLPYQHIPSGQKWAGNPAKYVADLTPEEKESIQGKAEEISEIAWDHICELLPYGYTYVQLEEMEKKAAEGAK